MPFSVPCAAAGRPALKSSRAGLHLATGGHWDARHRDKTVRHQAQRRIGVTLCDACLCARQRVVEGQVLKLHGPGSSYEPLNPKSGVSDILFETTLIEMALLSAVRFGRRQLEVISASMRVRNRTAVSSRAHCPAVLPSMAVDEAEPQVAVVEEAAEAAALKRGPAVKRVPKPDVQALRAQIDSLEATIAEQKIRSDAIRSELDGRNRRRANDSESQGIRNQLQELRAQFQQVLVRLLPAAATETCCMRRNVLSRA